MAIPAQITTPLCGSCGWNVRNLMFDTKDLGYSNDPTVPNAVCDACGADLTIHGFGKGTATAGAPGSVDGTVPYDVAGCVTLNPSPATAWTTGQYIVLGNGNNAYWDGTGWQPGIAP